MGERNPITFHTAGGETYFKDCITSHGDPLSDEEVLGKYLACCEGVLDHETAIRAGALIMDLENQTDCGEIMQDLTFGVAHSPELSRTGAN